jgi:hypothetical protein
MYAWGVDPAVGLGQIAEHATGIQAPQSWQDWQQREEAKATQYRGWQPAVRDIASILNVPAYMIAPEVMARSSLVRGSDLATQAARWLSAHPGTAGAITGGLGSILQPVEGAGNFALQKAEQLGGGLVAGFGLGKIFGRSIARSAENEAYKLAQQARKAAQEQLDRVQRYNKKIQELNKKRIKSNNARRDARVQAQRDYEIAQETARQDAAKGKTDTADKLKRAQQKYESDMSSANQQFQKDNAAHDQEHAAATKEVEEGYRAAQQAAQQAADARGKAAQEAVPGQTTQQFWKRVGGLIGKSDLVPDEIGPKTNARVQQIVGDHLNDLRGQMEFRFSQVRDPFNDLLIRMKDDGEVSDDAKAAFEKFYKDNIFRPINRPEDDLPLTGEDLSKYVSRIQGEIDRLYERSRNYQDPKREGYLQQMAVLRQMRDMVEQAGTAGKPELRQAIDTGKKAYRWFKLGDQVIGTKSGAKPPSPDEFIKAWEDRAGGGADFGRELLNNPNSEDAQLKQWLLDQRQAHQAPPPVTPGDVPVPPMRNIGPPPQLQLPPPEPRVGAPPAPSVRPGTAAQPALNLSPESPSIIPAPTTPDVTVPAHPGTTGRARLMEPRKDMPEPAVPPEPTKPVPPAGKFGRGVAKILGHGGMAMAGIPSGWHWALDPMLDTAIGQAAAKWMAEHPTAMRGATAATGAGVGSVTPSILGGVQATGQSYEDFMKNNPPGSPP